MALGLCLGLTGCAARQPTVADFVISPAGGLALLVTMASVGALLSVLR